MFLIHHNKFGVLLLLLLIGMSHYVHAKPVAVEIRSNQGDVVSFDYTITPDYDKAIVTIQFMNVRIKLDNKSSKYKNLQYAGKLEVLFLDGNNFEDGVTVELEKDNTLVSGINPITLSEGWEQSNHTIKTKATIFVINDTGEHKLKLNLGQQKGRLRIPIYLAKYKHKSGRKGFLGMGAEPEETTYTVFRECEPLEIELKPKPKPKPKEKPNVPSDPNPSPNDPTDDDDIIDVPPLNNQYDIEAWDLIQTIQPILDDATTKKGHEALKIYNDLASKMDSLEKYKKDTSPDIQREIDKLKGQYSSGKEKAKKEAKCEDDIDDHVRKSLEDLDNRLDSCHWSWSYLFKPFDELDNIKDLFDRLSMDFKDKVTPSVNIQINEFDTKIKAKEKELKPYLFIRKVIWGIWGIIAAALSLFGYNRWKNLLEQRKMKSFEEMQRRMADRAVSEAKRRAHSYTQNKTRQMVGKAKNKGRQAMQSQVKDLGERVKGQRPSPGDTPTIGNSPTTDGASRPPIGRFSGRHNHPTRRPKPGDNGEITI